MENQFYFHYFLALLLTIGIHSSGMAQLCQDGSTPIINTLDLTGLASVDEFNDPDNEYTVISGFAPNANIVAYEVSNINLNTIGVSWCSEARIGLTTNMGDNTGLFLTPSGDGSGSPCNDLPWINPRTNFVDIGIPDFAANGSGEVNVQLYEALDDNTNQPFSV